MKNFSRILALGGIAFSLGMASCKKDDASPSRTELISAKNWSQTKVEVTYAGSTVDITDQFIEDCQKDDLTSFSKDGVFKHTIGTVKCDVNETDETGTWSFTNSESTVHVVTDSETTDANIITLNSTTLKASFQTSDDINGDGKSETVTMTFTYTAK